ncbi:MAG: 16S rRNA (guanine(966)-N(2))-methyltransferase RsmD [Candidatus Omnitrophica bacterium]|nr:16S rRNA (guanine(966)-N(2))-methyltransferase RsmD [Candidatus Omnitrophota bacterium]
MRIISGRYKGRVIQMPKGIRPTQDKVRKALFDILGDISGLSFLELFAGSGAIGLEASSRGVTDLTLVEYNPDCLLAIKKNIASLAAIACDLYPRQAEKAIRSLHKEKRKFDIIFLDPPYYQGLAKKTLQTLSDYDILAPNGLVVVQHFKKDNLPENLGVLSLFRQAKYGDTTLSFYKKQ